MPPARKRKRTTTVGAPLSKRQKTGVKRLLGNVLETKHSTSVFSATSVSSTATLTALTSIAAGTDDTERVGDEVTLKRLTFRGVLTKGDTTNIVRLIIFQWKTPTQFATPTAGEILENYAGDGGLDLVRRVNYDNRRSFKVLHDKLYTMNNDVSTRTFKFTIGKQLIKKIQYDAAGTNQQNGVYAMYLSDSGAAAHPSMNLIVEKFYYDA